MTDEIKVKIEIEKDCIIYNGVRYEPVKEDNNKPVKLTTVIADRLGKLVNEEYLSYEEVCDSVDGIAYDITEELSQYIPNYSNYSDAFCKIEDEIVTPEDERYFKKGWDAYCKKMWDMLDDVASPD